MRSDSVTKDVPVEMWLQPERGDSLDLSRELRASLPNSRQDGHGAFYELAATRHRSLSHFGTTGVPMVTASLQTILTRHRAAPRIVQSGNSNRLRQHERAGGSNTLTNNNGYTGMNMLVVTTDPALSSAFREEANEIGVEAQTSGDFRETHQRFEAAKYEAVVVDFDTFPDSDLVIASIRESRCNKNAVVFAVATNRRHMEQALQRRAHFVLNRPLEASALRRTLRVAYDLMLKDRRRYFRCATVLPIRVRIVRTQNILECLSINVSSNGMAINASESLKLAETLEIEFALSGGFRIRAPQALSFGMISMERAVSTFNVLRRRCVRSWIHGWIPSSTISCAQSR
jgi:DNA-binding response OmpR family regulator